MSGRETSGHETATDVGGTGPGRVHAVHLDDDHRFSKRTVGEITVIAGVGVDGDAHAGPLVRHRSRVRLDPTQPNLRQVHLIDLARLEAASAAGHAVGPGDLGENITTDGIDLHALPTGTVLAIGTDALVALTGLRNPCGQIDGFSEGLREVLSPKDDDGERRLLGGVMGVVVRSGTVRPGDHVTASLPPLPHHPLVRV